MTSESTPADDETVASAEPPDADPPTPGGSAAGTRRVLPGAATFAFGSVVALAAGSWHEALPAGVGIALGGLVLAALGLVAALGLGTGDGRDPRSLAETWMGPLPGEWRWLAPDRAIPAALGVTVLAAIGLGPGVMPFVLGGAVALLVPASFRRPGMFVVVLSLAIHLPTLGVHGLWDPWETHYAEVAREILARNDWISLWWAQEEWFWSKPVGIFWAEAIAMRLLSVDPTSDAHPLSPEWAIRLPVLVTSVLATGAVYLAAARAFGRRAAVLAGVVMATMPHYVTLTRQAMTDMPFIGHAAIAMSLLLLAVLEDPDREVRPVALGRWTVSPQELAITGIVLLGLPQALYLIGRHVTLMPEGIAVHPDRFFSGSPGNGDVPGNAPPEFELVPSYDGLLAQPAVQGLLWLVLLAAVVWAVARERRAQGLLMVGFYVACALAFLGKGIPGFALPGLVALLFLLASGRWSLLLEGRLRVGLGAGIVAGLGLPWFVAMTVRHGPGFLDRLLVHDHLKRLGSGVHGDKGSVGYFLEQLGYATFPWAGWTLAAAIGVAYAAHRQRARAATPAASAPDRARSDGLLLVALWLFATFTLFNAMVTKFHHYIAPVIPPAAILVGVFLDRLLASREDGASAGRRWALGVAVATVGAGLLAAGFGAAWGDVRGVIPRDLDEVAMQSWVLDHPAPAGIPQALVLAGVVALATAHRLDRAAPPTRGGPRSLGHDVRRWSLVLALLAAVWLGGFVAIGILGLGLVVLAVLSDPGDRPGPGAPGEVALAAVALGGLFVVSFVGRDLSWATNLRPQGNERLVQLFIYNYDRPFPPHLDYRAALAGFAVAAGVVHGLVAIRATRRTGVHALLGLAALFTLWTVDVYLLDLSPHWTQRGLIDRYYAERSGPDEPLLAFQMNWKGENFYTGNRVHTFVDIDAKKLERWAEEQPEGRRIFILTEEGRIRRLERALGGARRVERLTTDRFCNKFVLVTTTL